MLGHIEDKRRRLLSLEKSLLNTLCAAFDPFEICGRSRTACQAPFLKLANATVSILLSTTASKISRTSIWRAEITRRWCI